MDKSKQKKKKRREPTYERKAIEVAKAHYEKQKSKAIHERRTFRGLQIIPTKSYYDDSRGHVPGLGPTTAAPRFRWRIACPGKRLFAAC